MILPRDEQDLKLWLAGESVVMLWSEQIGDTLLCTYADPQGLSIRVHYEGLQIARFEMIVPSRINREIPERDGCKTIPLNSNVTKPYEGFL